MVILPQVTVIVMITKLVENKKRKADQYWPDQGEQVGISVVDLGEGYNVEHISTSYQGTYFHR